MSPMTKIPNLVRRFRLQMRGVIFSGESCVEPGVFARLGWRNPHPGKIILGGAVTLGPGVVLDAFGGEIRCGNNVWFGPYTTCYGHGGIEIGDDTLISMHCRILSSNHAVPPLDTMIRSQADELRPTKIGRDVWLGAGVTILGGTTIGDGAVIAAGAVVSKDIPRGGVAMGVPAKVAKYRDERLPPDRSGSP